MIIYNLNYCNNNKKEHTFKLFSKRKRKTKKTNIQVASLNSNRKLNDMIFA